MLKTNEDVLNLLKLRHQFEDSDNKLLSYIDQAKERILGDTHLKRMPNQLFYEWGVIAYEFYQLDKAKESVDENGIVKSISEGDTKIDFERNKTPQSQDEVMLLHQSVLRKYRVLQR